MTGIEHNITWHQAKVTDADRRRVSGTAPQVLWLTGLSGSGKSTVGAELEVLLLRKGLSAYRLDGDNVRHGLCAGLGFSEEDRSENIRRIAEAARLIALSGTIVIVCVISPSAESRASARAIISADGRCRFDEVYISTPLAECAKRDPKGLYRRAYAGEIRQFTGINAPYDVPEQPEITIDTTAASPEDCASRLLDAVLASQTSYGEIVRTSVLAVLAAGEKILEIYARDFKIAYKEDSSPLTEADLASGAVITAMLRERFPYAAILCEEDADIRDADGVMPRLSNRSCFIVDPIDGTKEFIKKNGEFTVCIGFAVNHKAEAGVIYVPVTDTIYLAARGCGARKIEGASALAGEIRGGADIFTLGRPIHASERTGNLIVVASRSHPDEQTARMLSDVRNAGRIAQTVSAGSSLKGCMIAEGSADVHYRFGAFTKEWDTAAMQILCEEAGAVFLEGDGGQMLYNRTDVVNEKGFVILNRPESALYTDA